MWIKHYNEVRPLTTLGYNIKVIYYSIICLELVSSKSIGHKSGHITNYFGKESGVSN